MKLSAVIDWQHVTVAPLYLQACVPKFISESNPSPDQTEESYRAEHEALLRTYYSLYHDTGIDAAARWASQLRLGDKQYNPAQDIFEMASVCWNGGYAPLRRDLTMFFKVWGTDAGPRETLGVACPLNFSAEEIAQAEEDVDLVLKHDAMRRGLAGLIGVEPVDGWVSPSGYDLAMANNTKWRDDYLERVEGDPADLVKDWPYNPS